MCCEPTRTFLARPNSWQTFLFGALRAVKWLLQPWSTYRAITGLSFGNDDELQQQGETRMFAGVWTLLGESVNLANAVQDLQTFMIYKKKKVYVYLYYLSKEILLYKDQGDLFPERMPSLWTRLFLFPRSHWQSRSTLPSRPPSVRTQRILHSWTLPRPTCKPLTVRCSTWGWVWTNRIDEHWNVAHFQEVWVTLAPRSVKELGTLELEKASVKDLERESWTPPSVNSSSKPRVRYEIGVLSLIRSHFIRKKSRNGCCISTTVRMATRRQSSASRKRRRWSWWRNWKKRRRESMLEWLWLS